MLDDRTRQRLHHSLSALVEAVGSVMGRASIAHAAGLRAVRTGTPEDAQRFFRHLDRLGEADRLRIGRERDAIGR